MDPYLSPNYRRHLLASDVIYGLLILTPSPQSPPQVAPIVHDENTLNQGMQITFISSKISPKISIKPNFNSTGPQSC